MNRVGLNITENKLQLVEIVGKSNNYFLDNVDEESFSEKLNFQLSNLDFINILQPAFNNLKKRNSLSSENISIALPIDLFRIFSFPIEPELSVSDLHEQMEWEFSILFPTLSIGDFIVRQKKISNTVNYNPEILVIAIERRLIKVLFDFSKENNLSLQFVDNSHFTSDLLIDKNNSVSLYLSKNFISCFVYMNQELVGFRRFEPNNQVKLIDYLGDFTSEESDSKREFYISGDIEFDKTRNDIEESLKLNINDVNPFNHIPLSESFIQNEHYLNRANQFASAAGISFRTS